MIRILIVILFSLLVRILANAQDTLNDPFYLAGEINGGNYQGININANYIIRDKYSFQAGFSAHFRNGKDSPLKFSLGLRELFTMELDPFENVRNIQFLVGKIYLLNDTGSVRLNLSGGIGYTIIYTTVNWQTWGRVYSFDIKQYATMSIIINPKIEFPVSKLIGFSVSPMFILNKDTAVVGIGIGGMIGNVRSN